MGNLFTLELALLMAFLVTIKSPLYGYQTTQCQKLKISNCGNKIYDCTNGGVAVNKGREPIGFFVWQCLCQEDSNWFISLITSKQCYTQNGECNNSVKYGCLSSAAAIKKTITAPYYYWHCPGAGVPVGVTAKNCKKPRRFSNCGDKMYDCTHEGIVINKGQSHGYFVWQCVNKDDHKEISRGCYTQNGECNNNVKYGCLSSMAATNKSTSGGYYHWHCPGKGRPVGTTATDCKIKK